MTLDKLLTPNSVIANLKATNKKQALQELARHASTLTGVDERRIFDVLLERERLGSTGVGVGVAMPHARLGDIDTLFGLFARFENPVDFDAVDDLPVDLMFLLLAPESAGADHLKALARVSRLLRDKSSCAKLRGADNADALYALLAEPISTTSHDAA